jgi:hypothetical protein
LQIVKRSSYKTGRFETLVAFGYLHRLIHKGLIAYNLYFSSVAPISIHAAFEKVSIKQKRMFKTLAIFSIELNEEEFLLMEMSNELKYIRALHWLAGTDSTPPL